jgi:hypothetical protein
MNYLKYKMKEAGFISETLAGAIGISLTSFYKRTSEQVEWTCKEMKTVKEVLNLDQEEFNKIFGF